MRGFSFRMLFCLAVTATVLGEENDGLFLKSLSDRGHTVEVKLAKDNKLRLKEWDTWLYDGIVLFASEITEFGGGVDNTLLLEFVDDGKDLLIAVDSKVSDELRELITDLGVDLDTKGSVVTDHFNYEALPTIVEHTAVLTSQTTLSKAVLPQPLKAQVMYHGIGMSLAPDSQLVFAALTAEATAFTGIPGKALEADPVLSGSDITLVALSQTLNNARIAVAGSLDLFSNQFYNALLGVRVTRDGATASAATSIAGTPPSSGCLRMITVTNHFHKSGNAAFCDAVSKWVFHEAGVLRVSNLRHHHVGQAQQPAHYRISDDLEFAIDIFEFKDGVWQPFTASDVQLEFVMLDPYVRTSLKPDNQGTFSTQFKVPDVYGVFKFVVDYKRQGYSYIELSEQISVRPFRHNEFERFLVAAYPYYASAFSTMAAFFLFGFVFLYHK